MPEDYAKKLQSLLRSLFQFESADLDFGIYRIMNRKRDVIEKFIEKDLIASVDTEFGKISAITKESAKKEFDQLKTAIDKTLGSPLFFLRETSIRNLSIHRLVQIWQSNTKRGRRLMLRLPSLTSTRPRSSTISTSSSPGITTTGIS